MQIASSYAVSALLAPRPAAAPGQTAQSANAASTETAGATRTSARDRYAELAAKYDLRSMTPREIDDFAAQLPDTDIEAKMMILTRGEKFQRHLAEVLQEATGGDQVARFEARKNEKIDLIGSFETQLEQSRRFGDPTEALEEVIGYLHGIEARRYLPAEGVTV